MVSKHCLGINLELSSAEACKLLALPERTLRHQCNAGSFLEAHKDTAGSWSIPLSSLPPIAQARYWSKNLNIAPSGWKDEDLRDLPEEEAKVLWAFFEESSEKLKKKAHKDTEACQAWQVMNSQGVNFQDRLDQIKREFGLNKTSLYEKIARIKGYEPKHWPALLVGQWRGENARRAEWTVPAWGFFLCDVSSPGRKIKTAWDRTKREAEKQGWGRIPCYDTAKADWKSVPEDVKLALKGELTALKAKSPTAIREYDLPLHDTWSMDGRIMDVMVIDRKGKYGQAGRKFRPWIYAYMDIRSRVLLGYALGASLDADLLRDAFLDALKTTDRIIPREVQPDNGREGAAKEITGGAAWRRRGKVRDDEITGLFPMLGIKVGWTTVAHGQSKPVERFFLTLSQRAETIPEFRGAFCGNSQEKRPEEWDADKAVDVEIFEKFIEEEITAYNQHPHRGDGMEGKSPLQVYAELINQPGYIAKRVSIPQLRICAYSAVVITIRRNATFTILGASYWSEGTAKLAPGKGYYARYNPRDLSDTVYVYRGNKRLCEATKKELTSFNDKATAKEITRNRSKYVKSVKQQAKAWQELSASESRGYLNKLAKEVMPEGVDKETGEILPKPKVIAMVKNNADLLDKKTAEELENEKIIKEAKQLKDRESAGLGDLIRQRASGVSKRKDA